MQFRLKKGVRRFLRLVKSINHLRSIDFSVHFPYEGDTVVKLPVVKLRALAFQEGRDFVRRCNDFTRRPSAEPLLRKIVYQLIKTGYVDPDKYFIDIGSWIADNTIVWAKLLSTGGVFAVDPSAENLAFGDTVAKYNNIHNVRWIKAVCSDESNIPLRIAEGDLGHASFDRLEGDEFGGFITTTLDSVVPILYHKNVSLLHVDVEGFEEKVILGARTIISKSKPVIVFE